MQFFFSKRSQNLNTFIPTSWITIYFSTKSLSSSHIHNIFEELTDFIQALTGVYIFYISKKAPVVVPPSEKQGWNIRPQEDSSEQLCRCFWFASFEHLDIMSLGLVWEHHVSKSVLSTATVFSNSSLWIMKEIFWFPYVSCLLYS